VATNPDGVSSIEEYARERPQLVGAPVPALLRRSLLASDARTLLDAGCGDGAVVQALLREGLLAGRTLTALDLSTTRLERLGSLPDNVRAVADDAETLATVETGSIDYLISSQVIEHVDDARALAAIARVTHPGSMVYLSTVWKTPRAWYFHHNGKERVLDPTHLREYRADGELLGLLPPGLVVKESHKSRIAYPVVDFVMRRLGAGVEIYERSRILRKLRRMEVPLLGYFCWELVLARV